MPRKIKPSKFQEGGFLVEDPLTEEQIEMLRRWICDEEDFIREAQVWVATYRQMRKDDLERATLKQQVVAMDDLQEKIAALLSAVRDLDSETSDLLIDTIALRTKRGDIDLLPKEVKAHLRWLDDMIELAKRRIEGQSMKRRKTKMAPRFLTARVADLFERFNIPITSTDGSNFCFALSILANAEDTTVKNWAQEYLSSSSG